MNAIDIKLEELEKNHQLGLMAHAVVGYPTVDKSVEIIKALIGTGVDFLELQIPFSDPVADGETIMKACEVALKNGMNADKVFEMVGKLDTEIPILLMAYYNTVFRYGIDKFCKKASQLGVAGLIVPDIPLEEEKSEKFISFCLKYGLYPIRVVSPSSSAERLKINSKFARGFVYCISHFGITGSQAIVDRELFAYLKKVKQLMKLPVAVGFGIERKEQVTKLKGVADIAIVGSAIIKNYDTGGIKKVSSFIKDLKKGTMKGVKT